MGQGPLKVLVVDDQPAVRTSLELLFDVHGLASLMAGTPEEALRLVRTEDVGVVVQDMNFRRDATSGSEGTALLRAIKELDPDLPVLLMTAFTSLEAAVQLVKEGASDYIAKPWDDDKLIVTVRNLMRVRELELENRRLVARGRRARQELGETHDLCGLIYASEAMQDVIALAVKVAPADVPVLITGPNGAGKERLAKIVQANSRRRSMPFLQVNAGGLPDELLEAELFGAEAGAYTGAKKLRVGRFEEASGGTLFLDEIGNLSPSGQMKLLRVLQTGELQRLGSNVTRRTDVRIISATNANLPQAIANGTFREDLYFRLNVIELALPPLRDRMADVEPLAAHFLAQHRPEGGGPKLTFGADALRALLEHEWPGNVRELENRIQRGVLVCKDGVVTARDLGLAGASARPEPRASEPTVAVAPGDPERIAIEKVLLAAGGIVSKAAAELGVSRQALYRRMERLGIAMERRPR
jgi:DNA-binding NtrC family response regulator